MGDYKLLADFLATNNKSYLLILNMANDSRNKKLHKKTLNITFNVDDQTYKARIVPCDVPTCHVKYWLETKAKPTNFHWIFDFVTVTEHSDPPPVAFGKLGVIVGIKRWSLLRSYKFELKTLSNDQFN